MKNNVLKVFAVLLAVMMFFSFASCGGKDEGKDISDAAGITKKTEGELTTEKNIQAPTVTAGAEANGKDGSAKPGGKDTGKDPGKSDDNKKSTGGNTSETSKPSGGKTKETTSAVEPEEKDNEGEFVIPPQEIQLPVVPLK